MSSEVAAPARADGVRVVEFLGIPGSGKTTLAAVTAELLRAGGATAGTPVEMARDRMASTAGGRAILRFTPPRARRALLWQLFYVRGSIEALRFARAEPRLRRLVFETQRGRPVPPSFRRHVLFWFFQLGGRMRLLRSSARKGTIVLLDDGFLHRSVALHASRLERPDPAAVERYVDLIPEPDLVIVPIVRPQACAARVERRGLWAHSRHLQRHELEAYLANAATVVTAAADRARRRGWNVVEVPNEERDLDAVGADLGLALRSLADLDTSATAGSR
jgi:thymidylate kinase